jgi:hypothetical protein
MEELASGFDDAGAGRGSLFLIVGPAGMGKTRLADEVTRGAEARGMRAVWGRCWETGGAPAYWPWIQILREVTRAQEAGERAALAESLGADADALGQLLPELAPAASAPAPPAAAAGSDPAATRFRLFQAVMALLRAAADRQPLLLVFDDLHAADPSSLTLLHFAARNLRGLRALIIGAYRDEEARLSPEVGPALTDIAREGTYLPLGALAHADVAALVAAAAGDAASPGLIDACERASEGNPLFLNELLRLLIQRGDIGRPSGDPAALPVTLPIPDTVREVIGRRIARLSDETRELLETASVAGRDFGSRLVAALCRRPLPDVEHHLDDAERLGLIAGSGPRSWRFSHVLVREALYRAIEPARRAGTHLAIAQAVAGTADDGASAEVAHHLLAALPAGDPAAAAAAARRAADRAMAMLAFEDAALLLEKAHHALASARAPDPRELCRLELLAGVAHMRAGAGDRGRAACARAADRARQLGDGELLAQAAVAYGAELMLAQTDRKLVELLEEALAALPAGPSGLRAECLARLAAALQPCPEPAGPLAMARQAVTMARGIDDDAVRCAVLSHAGSALADYAEPAERAALSEELARLAAARGDRVLVLRAQSRLAFDHFEMGNAERTARAIDAYEAEAREMRQPRHMWPGRLMRAMRALAVGRFDEADRLLEQATEQARGDRDRATAVTFLFHAIGRALVTERAQDLTAAENEIARLLEQPGEPFAQPMEDLHLVFLAALRARAGDAASAGAHLGAVNLDSPFLAVDGSVICLAAEAAAVTRDQQIAALLYERLMPHAERLACFGRTGMVSLGPIAGYLGRLAEILGRPDEAARHFEAAIARERAAGFLPTLARLQLAYAGLLLVRGRPGDQARARELAAEAGAVAGRLGLRLLEEGLRRLDAAGAPAPAPTPVERPRPTSFTLVREGELWTVSAGMSVVRLRDTRGLEMLAELVANPGREMHVLALMGAGTAEAVDGGDAGTLLDQEAVADYRARLDDLDDEIAEADAWNDAARAGRAREEREALTRELARGVGLGGRERRAGGAAERARTNVQRRIRGAIRKIGESMPELAAYLERAVRTGTYCSYEPF